MSVAQTMEAVSILASTLLVLTTVSVEVATDCPVMEEVAMVCSLFRNSLFVSTLNFILLVLYSGM